MNYRTAILIVIAGLCLQTARVWAQADQIRKDEPNQFEGLAYPAFTLPDGRVVPLFETATPKAALNGPANISQDKILTSVAAEGAELRKGIDLAGTVLGSKTFTTSFTSLFKVNGKEVDNMLLVIVCPQKQSTPGKIFKNPVTFTPGQVARLAEALATFGQPTETQLWSSSSSKDLDLDGSVYWWGEVGVSTSPDGAISHVLLRKVIDRK